MTDKQINNSQVGFNLQDYLASLSKEHLHEDKQNVGAEKMPIQDVQLFEQYAGSGQQNKEKHIQSSKNTIPYQQQPAFMSLSKKQENNYHGQSFIIQQNSEPKAEKDLHSQIYLKNTLQQQQFGNDQVSQNNQASLDDVIFLPQQQQYLPLMSIKRIVKANSISAANNNQNYSNPNIQNKYFLDLPEHGQIQNSYYTSEEQFSFKCENCNILKEKLSESQNKNDRNLNQMEKMKEQLQKSKQQKALLSYNSTNQKDQSQQRSQLSVSENCSIIQILMIRISQIQKTFNQINNSDAKYHDLSQHQRQILQAYDNQYKHFKRHFNLCHQKNKIDLLNKDYLTIITKIIKDCKLKIQKKQKEFQMVMDIFVKNNLVKQKDEENILAKQYKMKKRVSQCQIKKQNQLSVQIKQLKKRNTQLQNMLTKNKEKIQFYQSSITKYSKSYQQQIKELKRSRDYYKDINEKTAHQFESVMKMITGNTLLTNTFSHENFQQISRRIFQISNCIPFEDNDEQNLFVPENQSQLFEMIQRIYNFYNKIERENNKLNEQLQKYKRNTALFLKQLVQSEKISLKFLSQLIKKYKELRIQHLIKYIITIRQRRTKNEQSSLKKGTKKLNKSLSMNENYHFLQMNSKILSTNDQL